MTKEELEKEAEEYLHKDGTESEKLVKDIGMLCLTKKQLNGIFAIFKQIYIDSAEPRERRIEELEAQIEKMKCCGNCIHCKYDENEESYEYCEKHQQVVNIAIVPCSEYERR